MALSTNIYAEVTTTFPASVEAGSGIIILKSGGVYTVSFDPSSIAMNSITNAQMAAVSGQRLIGNPAGIAADRSEISLGSDLEFSGTTVQGAALTGAVAKAAGGTTTTLGTGVVGSANLADGAATSAKIGANAVDGTKIADNAIGNEHIADDAVQAAQIATDAVGADAIAANAVGASELADNAVDTAAIADDAVTLAKVADMANATVLSNVSGGSASPSANSLSALLDGTLGATQGSILYRAASTWLQLGPGTNGQVLQSGGAGANPSWVNSSSGGVSQGTFTAWTTASLDFTGIPSGTNVIILTFETISTNGATHIVLQIGDAGGLETTGYIAGKSFITAGAQGVEANTNGFQIWNGAASQSRNGALILTKANDASNIWSCFGVFFEQSNPFMGSIAGTKLLSAELDRIRITTVSGTDVGDAGSIGITYF